MTIFNYCVYIVITLFLINNIALSQTPSPTVFCSGDLATQFCVCYLTSIDCKKAIYVYQRYDCFYHITHGCISITNPPTTNPTLNPTLIPTQLPTYNPSSHPTNHPTFSTNTPTLIPTNIPTIQPTQSPTPIIPISTLNCGNKISGNTSFTQDINWYALVLEQLTNIFIDSCGSSYDTWLYFHNSQNADSGSIIDCDDCGYCSLQSQLQISNVHKGIYMIGIGGYRGDFGSYTIHIACTTTTTTNNPTINPVTISPTLYPTKEPTYNPTDIPTPNPTPKPIQIPTAIPIINPTLVPTQIPSKYPTEIPSTLIRKLPTMEPTYNLSRVPTIAELETHSNDMDFFHKNGNKITGFELALIFAVLLIILMIGCMSGIKYITKRKQHHLNISVVGNEYDSTNNNEQDTDGSESEEDEVISYVHALTNNVIVDEILARAKTDLIHLVTDENNPFVE